jgi:signal transduction histidine kinase
VYSTFSQSTWKPRWSVKLRFALAQGLFIAIIIMILAVTLYFPVRDRLVTISNGSYQTLAYTLAPSIYDSYQKNDREALTGVVHRVDIQQGVKYVLIVAADNTIYYDTISGATTLEQKTLPLSQQVSADKLAKGDVLVQKVQRDGVGYYIYVAPFIVGNKVLYTVQVAVDQDTVDGEFNRLAYLFMNLGAVGIIIGVIASYVLASRLTQPITKLTESALAIRAGNLNAYPDIQTNDELEQLAREFQSMVEKLKQFYFQEYTQKKEAVGARKQLMDINKRLQELDRQKSDFMNAASHQLRTPLSIIHWSLSLIVEESEHMDIKPEHKELLTESLKSTKRMVDLVNDLLDISRIEQGRKELSWEKGNFATVCEQLVAALQPLANNKGLQLTYEKIGEVDDSFLDEKNFYQVVNNFVDNAVKYTAEGFVKVSCQQQGKEIMIKISDSGIGMNDDEKKDLFTRFSRGDEAQKMFPNGSGLGMYVARTILFQHGGRIDVDSEKGKGTTFTLTVPVFPEVPNPAPGVKESLTEPKLAA